MNKHLLIILFIFFAKLTLGADSLEVVKKLSHKRYKLNFNTQFDIASNCINTQTFQLLSKGGFISNNDKENLLQRSKNYNRAGFDFDNQFTVQFNPKRLLRNYFKWLEIGFANRMHAHTGFSKDALSLLLNGNTQYLGKTANLDGLLFNLLQYQQVRIGFASDSNDSLKSKFVFGISILNGQRNIYFNAPTFRLLTAADGYSIAGNVNYQLSNVPTSMSKFGTNNGLGFSLDIDYKENYSLSFLPQLKNQIHFNLRDAGFIQWSSNSYNLGVDSNLYYRGMEIHSLKDSLLWPFTGDSLKHSFFNYKRSAYSTTLPAFFLIENTLTLNNKNFITIGLQHRTLAAYKLQIRINYEYKFNKKYSANCLLTKGGYNNYSVNLGGKIVIINKAQIMLGINQIQTLFSQTKSGGFGAFAGLIFWL